MYSFFVKFEIASSEIWYANPDGLQREEVLSRILEEDFLLENQSIAFSDEHFKRIYSHFHVRPPQEGITLMKIANKYVKNDDHMFWQKYPWNDRGFSTVLIICREGSTCFFIEENTKAFANIDTLVKILCRGLNTILNQEGLSIVPSSDIVRQNDDIGLMCAAAVINKQIGTICKLDARFYENAPRIFDEKKLLATKLFTSALTEPLKASLVIQTLYALTKGKRDAKILLCALKAALDAKVMVKPSYKDFIEVFECGDIITKKQYCDYTNPKYKGYEGDALYDNCVEAFMKIKNLEL